MKLQIFGYEKSLCVDNGEIAILNIQNRTIYRNLIEFLNNKEQFNSSNDFVLEETERIKFDDFVYVDNVLLHEFDNKKIVGKIITNYSNYLCADEEENSKLTKAVNDVVQSFTNYLMDDEYDLYIDDFQISSILKAIHITMPEYYEKITDKVSSIINIYSKVFKNRIFIFNNLTQYIGTEEFQEIERIAKKYVSSIILVESQCFEYETKQIAMTIGPDFGCY